MHNQKRNFSSEKIHSLHFRCFSFFQGGMHYAYCVDLPIVIKRKVRPDADVELAKAIHATVSFIMSNERTDISMKLLKKKPSWLMLLNYRTAQLRDAVLRFISKITRQRVTLKTFNITLKFDWIKQVSLFNMFSINGKITLLMRLCMKPPTHSPQEAIHNSV